MWEQAGSSGMLTLTSLTIWLRWEQAVGGGSGFAGSSESGFAGSKLVAVECSLSPLTISLRREQAVSGGSGFAGKCSLSPLRIWLRWEQAVSGGSGFAGSSGSGFAGGSGMLALTSDNLALQGASC